MLLSCASRLINLHHEVSVQLDKRWSATDRNLNSAPRSAGESDGFQLESLSWISGEMEFSLSQAKKSLPLPISLN